MQRGLRIGRVEVELDHLPVALVRVVEVVEGVEEPELERDLPRIDGIGGDVRVDGRLRSRRDPAVPLLVTAPRIERVAGKVEVVLVAADEIHGDRRDLDQIRWVPRPAEGNGVLTEE